jgi:hypothetical protein
VTTGLAAILVLSLGLGLLYGCGGGSSRAQPFIRLLLLSAEVRRRIRRDFLDLWASRLARGGVIALIAGTARTLGHVLEAARDGVRHVSGAPLSHSPSLVQNPLNPLSTLIAIRQRSRSSSTRRIVAHSGGVPRGRRRTSSGSSTPPLSQPRAGCHPCDPRTLAKLITTRRLPTHSLEFERSRGASGVGGSRAGSQIGPASFDALACDHGRGAHPEARRRARSPTQDGWLKRPRWADVTLC